MRIVFKKLKLVSYWSVLYKIYFPVRMLHATVDKLQLIIMAFCVKTVNFMLFIFEFKDD